MEPTNHAGVASPSYFTFDGLNRTSTVKDGLMNVTYMGYDARSKLVKRVVLTMEKFRGITAVSSMT